MVVVEEEEEVVEEERVVVVVVEVTGWGGGDSLRANSVKKRHAVQQPYVSPTSHTVAMGCCASVPGVPDVILPDPDACDEQGGQIKFYCKPSGTFSSNYTVLKGDKEGPTWLFMRKRGKLFKDDISIVLENFVRTDTEHPDEGQALSVCKFDTLDSNAYKFYGGCFDAYQDSDNSDGYSADEGDGAGADVDKQSGKFLFVTKSKFFTDRKFKNKVAEIKVKAKGKVKRVVTWNKRDITNAEGAVTGHEWAPSQSHETKVKKLVYKFVTIDAASGAETEVPIHLHGSLNSAASENKWESPMFNCKIKGGFFSSDKPVITTSKAPNFSHALSLMAGYVCSIELSPQDVKENCRPPFPLVTPPEPNSNGILPSC